VGRGARAGRAAFRITTQAAARGELDELRSRADASDWAAASRLAGLLAARGELDERRARADAGDPFVGQRLPGLLEKQGRGEEAAAPVRLEPGRVNRLGVKERRTSGDRSSTVNPDAPRVLWC